MSVFQRPAQAKEISEVNVVPLADVSLVLLIILLVLSPMMTQSMLNVKTAAKDSSEAPPEPPETAPLPPDVVLAVELTPTGYALGDRTYASSDEFRAALAATLAQRTDKKVFLSPAPDVTHGAVVDALQLIARAGADSVALVQTETETDGQVRPAAAAP